MKNILMQSIGMVLTILGMLLPLTLLVPAPPHMELSTRAMVILCLCSLLFIILGIGLNLKKAGPEKVKLQ